MDANRIFQTLGRALSLLIVGVWAAGVTAPPHAVHSATATPNPYTLAQTFVNPDPSPNTDVFAGESFGASVLWVSVNPTTTYALLGAPGKTVNAVAVAGAAYLYTNPQSNPTPTVVLTASQYITDAAQFGWALAAAGTPPQLLVGAPYDNLSSLRAGGAYRFDLTGALVMTLTKPAPAANGDNFGYAVAGYGDDALVGAYLANATAGQAYRFNGATGVLSQTITPPPPSPITFGKALAQSGSTLFVGAPGFNFSHGLVYAYDLSGPTPSLTWVYSNTEVGAWEFGAALAVYDNKLLIGEPSYQSHGRAYLYDTSTHALLNTYEYPDVLVSGDEKFGAAVSLYGGQVLIGAPGYDANQVAANNTGSAYLFNADVPYALVQRFDNPTLAQDDAFGTAVAVGPGTDLFLVGAPLADIPGAVNAGKVYLFAPSSGQTLLYLPLIQR